MVRKKSVIRCACDGTHMRTHGNEHASLGWDAGSTWTSTHFMKLPRCCRCRRIWSSNSFRRVTRYCGRLCVWVVGWSAAQAHYGRRRGIGQNRHVSPDTYTYLDELLRVRDVHPGRLVLLHHAVVRLPQDLLRRDLDRRRRAVLDLDLAAHGCLRGGCWWGWTLLDPSDGSWSASLSTATAAAAAAAPRSPDVCLCVCDASVWSVICCLNPFTAAPAHTESSSDHPSLISIRRLRTSSRVPSCCSTSMLQSPHNKNKQAF